LRRLVLSNESAAFAWVTSRGVPRSGCPPISEAAFRHAVKAMDGDKQLLYIPSAGQAAACCPRRIHSEKNTISFPRKREN
jgi:hypothetical protein